MTAVNDSSPPQPRQSKSERVNFFDHSVGKRIRERRLAAGMTQQELALLVGVTHQQQHKYENGLNRISAGRVFVIARIFEIPVGWLFGEVEEYKSDDFLSIRQKRAIEFVRDFELIQDGDQQKALSQMTRALAAKA